ncbi:MAG: D-alanyl-D-alanine carboxypeptidase family protein [Candidatus Spechtbacterales bacterium]
MRKRIIFLSLSVTFGAFVLFYGFNINKLTAAILQNGNYIFNLLNRENSLGDYKPLDLVSLAPLGAPDDQIREIAHDSLVSLVDNAKEKGISIEIISAYRSRDRQKKLRAYYAQKYGSAYADRISSEAGHSEHQLGTTVDFGSGNPAIDLKQAFAETAQARWLENNAWKYGFVLSYPKDVEKITGFIYEPWHYRFIGTEAAGDLRGINLTLWEYLNLAPQYYVPESLRGKIVKTKGSVEVYYITEAGYKRHLPSPKVFESYENSWDKIILIDPDTLKGLPVTQLIHLDGAPEIYSLSNDGEKRLIHAPEVLRELAERGGVVPVNIVEFNYYSTGPVMLNSSQTDEESSGTSNLNEEGLAYLNVLFTPQAPYANWEDPRQQYACEEASVLMAMKWANGATSLSKQEALNEITSISDYELRKYGEYRDTSARDTLDRIFKDYFGYNKVSLEENISADNIREELNKGNIVIVPVNGRKLNNPYYTLPGPVEHMIVIIGYDLSTDEFITNDPGTIHGKDFRYNFSTIQNAMQDYPTGFHEPIEAINKVMMVVEKS